MWSSRRGGGALLRAGRVAETVVAVARGQRLRTIEGVLAESEAEAVALLDPAHASFKQSKGT